MKLRGMSGTAMRLAKLSGSKRPRETDLRRAVSTNYYALFLFLCYLLADLWIGATPAARDKPRMASGFQIPATWKGDGGLLEQEKNEPLSGTYPQVR